MTCPSSLELLSTFWRRTALICHFANNHVCGSPFPWRKMTYYWLKQQSVVLIYCLSDAMHGIGQTIKSLESSWLSVCLSVSLSLSVWHMSVRNSLPIVHDSDRSFYPIFLWKIAKIGEKQRRTAKISPSYKKSVSINPFAVTNLRPEVELMHLLRTRRHYRHKSRPENGVARRKLPCLYRKMAGQNSNMTLDFNPFTADPVKALHFATLV